MTYNILSHSNINIFPTKIHQSIFDALSTKNISKPNYIVNSTELITISKELLFNETVGKLGIFPPGIGNVFKCYNYLNQKFIWMFRKVLYRYKCRLLDKPSLIANTEDLIGYPIDKQSKSKRVLKLWDNQSSKYYYFTINDLIGIFKSSLINDDNPVHPKNPYTNLEFTIGQIVVIYQFFQINRDRIPICYSSIIAYCKWNKSLRIIHNYNTIFYYQSCNSLRCNERDEKLHETILLDSLFNKRRHNIRQDKQELYDSIRKIFLYLILNGDYDIDNIIPETKMEYYVLNTYINYGGIRTLGILNKWLEINSIRYRIKSKVKQPTSNTNDDNCQDNENNDERNTTDNTVNVSLTHQFKRMRLS